MTKKSIIPIVVIGIIGAVISLGSFLMLNSRLAEPEPTKALIVSTREIPPYQTLRTSDIRTIQVPVTTPIDGFVTSLDEIIGNVSNMPLEADAPILRASLLPKEKLDDLVFVTILTSFVRSGGATVGDIVDVYRVMPAQANVTQTQLVVANAKVTALTTKEGLLIENQSGGILERTASVIGVVRLAVRPRDARTLVSASIEQEAQYVLVVRSAASQDIPIDESLRNIIVPEIEVENATEIEGS